jgi:hypothetical protein
MRVLIDRLKRWFEPWQVREERRRAERKALLAAVNARLKPRIRELGFSSARTEAWRGSRFKNWLSGWGFIRMSADRVDLLDIYWDKHGGALFRIVFASQRLEDWEAIRWGEACKFGSVIGASAEAPRRVWFGERQSVDEAIELALRQMGDVDVYLNGGPLPPSARDRSVMARRSAAP